MSEHVIKWTSIIWSELIHQTSIMMNWVNSFHLHHDRLSQFIQLLHDGLSQFIPTLSWWIESINILHPSCRIKSIIIPAPIMMRLVNYHPTSIMMSWVNYYTTSIIMNWVNYHPTTIVMNWVNLFNLYNIGLKVIILSQLKNLLFNGLKWKVRNNCKSDGYPAVSLAFSFLYEQSFS